ncbi:MAG: hypothetical protein LBT09_03330 [Planctomycetaceae bacterium]|jgi:hypothetical protein|nr:hypothetical protein [Planctomycetaceae bacterium]
MMFLLFVGDHAVPNLHRPDFYLNNDQPAQPLGGRIACFFNFTLILNSEIVCPYCVEFVLVVLSVEFCNVEI